LIGAVGFLTGAGVFDDWFRWTRGEETQICQPGLATLT
jgi:hypothetical protein